MCVFYALLFAATLLYRVTSETPPTATILVFGGTGNIGSEVVNELILNKYKPTLVSRGNWMFDSEKRIKPHVKHIKCDRYKEFPNDHDSNSLKRCPELIKFLDGNKFIDFVIDFSAYTSQVVGNAIEVLKDKVGLYIYISSDSVYEVCVPGSLPIKETDDVRPKDADEREELAKEDSYGNGKLEIEEALKKQRKNNGFPYMVLRLPDVIGPRDTTHRWWTLQLWIKYYHTIRTPITLNKGRTDFRSSLVYNKDIAKVILSAMQAGSVVHDNAYNIGFDESFTYTDIVKAIAAELKISGIEFVELEQHTQSYPSVTRGPIDTTKIKQHLGFTPTSWKKALKYIVAWYERALFEYPDNVKFLLNFLIQEIVPLERQSAFISAVETRRTRTDL